MTNFNLQRSRYDVRHFYEWLGYTWGDHISDWFDLLEDRKQASVHRVCLIAPRDHSKSTTLRVKAVHSLLFEKWRDKPYRIWLFSASKDLAANRIEEIREDLRRHPSLSKMLDETRGGKWDLRMTNGAWIKASSVGSAIRGEHPSCIILDDVLDEMGDISDDSVKQWFRKKLTPMLSPGTSIYCVGTPLSLNDLYHTEMLNNETWKTWMEGSITNYDEWLKDPTIDPICLWPEFRPIEFLLEQKQAMGDLAFSQEYMCRVVDDEAAVYPSRLTRANLSMESVLEEIKLHPGRYAIGFDPAHGIGQDYSVMVVMRQDENGFLHLVNIWRFNDREPSQQVDEIIRLCQTYKNHIFASESAGFQRLYEVLIAQRGANIDYVASAVNNRVQKQGLLTRLRSWFEQKKIIFPYGDDHTRRVVNILLDELETHAWDKGVIVDKGKHNDCVMAMAHACDQFTHRDGDVPVVGGGVSVESWNNRANPSRVQRTAGRYVRFGG